MAKPNLPDIIEWWKQSGWVQGAYNVVAPLINGTWASSTHEYTDPEDTEEDEEETQEYTTQVVYGTPLRQTKVLFVSEMNDFYTEEELNTLYHSAAEYRNSYAKYGIIYKTQKFENADTAEKLLEYATDWIKNNYHGGITNFTITALDLHILDYDCDKFLCGDRATVQYIDPDVKEEVSKTLTVISAEYDLNKPENNKYKIGIPDVTLNKVYGETSKSGGGGGGGGKTSDETDDETNTELDDLMDQFGTTGDRFNESLWAFIVKKAKNGDTSFDLGDLLPPGVKDQVSNWVYCLKGDLGNFTALKTSALEVANSIGTSFLQAVGGVDTNILSANKVNGTTVNSEETKASVKMTTKDMAITDDATVGKDLTVEGTINGADCEFTGSMAAKDMDVTDDATVGKDLTVIGTISGAVGEFSGGLMVDGKAVLTDLPTTVELVIDDVRYVLYGRRKN